MRSHHGTISLAPLDSAQVREMVAELSARHALARDVVDDVAARTGGVPLFVEEVTRLLLERGEQSGAQAIPPTLQQSLMARLDRLGPAREVAQIGSVIGRGFSYKLLQAVAGMDEAPLEAALEKLSDADILLVEGVLPESDYRFKHALIQDAAYENLLKTRRQVLHRRTAEALRDRFADKAATEPEVLAHHFTQAGLTDPAIEWWGKAGDQALRRSAFQEAIAQLGKAIEMAGKSGDGAPQATAAPAERLRLQTAYGSALLHGRGMQSPETQRAFSRAQELVAGPNDPSERFSIQYALWAGHFVRGELAPLREIAELALREVKERPASPEAVVGFRLNGATEWFAGNFTAARAFLERARDILHPQRHSDPAFRFAQDVGVSIAAYLALVLWVLGEVDQARAVADQGMARAMRTGHVGTIGYAHFHFAVFEMLRRSDSASAASIETFVDVSRAHEMEMWTAYGKFLAPWARRGADGTHAVLSDMRDGIATCRGQNIGNYIPFFATVLGEAEAQAGETEQALATIDGVVGDSERSGQRWFAAETHRIRGEILLKRDTANTGRAEEAFLAAIVIARQQNARSFELRAALSLAKLYQGANRAADAHAVLAPALEGFSPTPEFPEIAEAQALLNSLEQDEAVKAKSVRRERRVQLQLAYGAALMSARGYGAEDTVKAFDRARELSAGVGRSVDQLALLYGTWLGAVTTESFEAASKASAALLMEATQAQNRGVIGVAHRAIGATLLYGGLFDEAKHQFEEATSLLASSNESELAQRFNGAPRAAAHILRAIAAWVIAKFDQAVKDTDEARSAAERAADAMTQGYVYGWAATFGAVRRDVALTGFNSRHLLNVVADTGLRAWAPAAEQFERWSRSMSGGESYSASELRAARPVLKEVGHDKIITPVIGVLAAEAEIRNGRADEALALTGELITEIRANGLRWQEAELLRIRGEALLLGASADPDSAVRELEAAIAISREQGARTFELRAALPLAKLYRSSDRAAHAHAVLAPALAGFSPTSNFPETAEAQILLAEVEKNEEVKKETASRQRRLKLQTSLGEAMIHARGHGAPETTAAFARAANLAAHVEDSAESFSARYGLWTGGYMRGDRATRELSMAFLRDAERLPRSPEVLVGHRIVGISLRSEGDYISARMHLEEALSAYDQALHGSLAFRYGVDTRVSCMVYLALTLWPLGEIERARLLAHEALAAARATGHIATVAYTLGHVCYLELLSRDSRWLERHAKILVELSREHDLRMWLAISAFQHGYALWRSGEVDAGEAHMRDGIDANIEQGNKRWLPLFQGRLAEIEAEAKAINAALSRIEQALALADETGEHWTDAFLHRLRGEILLKRDPANTAPAEEAFLTAIAIAQRQKARSFELSAAMSMARLWHDRGKPQQARELLAPVYEWFTEGHDTLDLKEAKALLEEVHA
jgi:predicted ATPase